MHIACRNGYLECVIKLIEHNVTTDVVNKNLDTPLSVAISEKHENVAIYMLRNSPGNLEMFNSVSEQLLINFNEKNLFLICYVFH